MLALPQKVGRRRWRVSANTSRHVDVMAGCSGNSALLEIGGEESC